MEDEEAITRLRRGDVTGLDVLMQRYQRLALRIAYLICRDRALSEDIVQTGFVRLYERIGRFDSTRPFGPWFLRSITNDALMATRRKHISLDTEAAKEGLSIISADQSLFDAIEVAETKEAIWAILDRLSPVQRSVIVMRYYLELSDREIADALEIPPGTVRRRLHDAHQNLRRMLPSWVK